jgi:hypothetical protein
MAKIDYPIVKKYLQIFVFSFNLLVYIIVLFSTNSKSKTYKEYTGSSKFFLALYVILIYAFLITITIYPGILYHRLKAHLNFVFNDKGKLILAYLICLIFWFSKNKPHLVYAILSTIITIFLLIYEFIFYFQKFENFLNNKGIEFINRKMTTIDINNLRKSNSDMNQGNNEITDSNNPDDKKSNEQKQQIADVVSGYD